jgi:hypothetical protein
MGGSQSSQPLASCDSFWSSSDANTGVLADELLNICNRIDTSSTETEAKKAELESRGISTAEISVPRLKIEIKSNPEKLKQALKTTYGNSLKMRFGVDESVIEVFSGCGGSDTVYETQHNNFVTIEQRC